MVGTSGAARADGVPAKLSLLDTVKLTLEKNPGFEAGREQREGAKGALEAASSPFDTSLDVSANHTRDTTSVFVGAPPQETRLSSLQLGASKKFRFGTVVSPSIQIQRVEVISEGARIFGPQNTGRVVFQVNQPLLRGLGSVAHAGEDAASSLYDAAVNDLRHAASERVMIATQAYWSYAAAHLTTQNLIASEARFVQLLENTKALVKAQERPASDLEQLQASLADQRRSLAEATQSEREAKVALGLEMGLTMQEIDAIESPLTSFPDVAISKVSPKAVAELARANRKNLAALEARVTAAGHLVRNANDALWPQLDLLGSVGWTGTNQSGGFSDLVVSVGDNIPGVNVSVGARLFWPIENSAASGGLAQAVSAQRQAIILRDSALREVAVTAETAAHALTQSQQAATLATEAVSHHRRTVENEKAKLQNALATLVDVIYSEENLANAEAREVSARARFASAIARVRFESGTITVYDGDAGSIEQSTLMTPPEGGR